MRASPFVTFLALIALTAIAHADVLMHKDGRRIEGTIKSEKDGKIVIKTEFGDMTFPRADIVSIEKGKTRWQEFEEREQACKTAEDFFQLGEWARQKKMTKETKRCMQKALELDPKHAGANQYLGRVQYKDEWMTPEERDKRVKADEIAAKTASGLVEYEGRWITAEEKGHLEKGEVLVDGKWIPFEDAQRAKGLEKFGVKWMPLVEAQARESAAAVEKLAGIPLEELVTEDALICGPQTQEELTLIAGLMKTGRTWFDATFIAKPGLEMLGGRLPEFYMFVTDDSYLATCELLTGRIKTATRDWSEWIKTTNGFYGCDPYGTSSVRVGTRSADQLRGHDLHHLGHILVNRLGYDRRLLPPWYDEGVAALFEFKSQGKNSVTCAAPKPPDPAKPTTGGDSGPRAVSTRPIIVIDEAQFLNGQWKSAVAAKVGEIPPFEDLATFEYHSLQSAYVGASMAIVAWIESHGPGSLRKFHDVVRSKAPYAPRRIVVSREDRAAMYDEAFEAATGKSAKDADRAWRVWVTQK